MADLKLVSSDSHVMEPPDLWLNHIDPEYKDRAPHVVSEGEFDQWYADGEPIEGAVSASYRPGSAQLGAVITVAARPQLEGWEAGLSEPRWQEGKVWQNNQRKKHEMGLVGREAEQKLP